MPSRITVGPLKWWPLGIWGQDRDWSLYQRSEELKAHAGKIHFTRHDQLLWPLWHCSLSEKRNEQESLAANQRCGRNWAHLIHTLLPQNLGKIFRSSKTTQHFPPRCASGMALGISGTLQGLTLALGHAFTFQKMGYENLNWRMSVLLLIAIILRWNPSHCEWETHSHPASASHVLRALGLSHVPSYLAPKCYYF